MAVDGAIAPDHSLLATKHIKRLLPPALASEAANGPINKSSRSEGEQAALEKRKNEVLQSMAKEQIDAAYSGIAVKINEHLQRKAKKDTEIDGQLAQLKAEHEMEIRVIKASLERQEEKRGGAGGEEEGVKGEMEVDDEYGHGEAEGVAKPKGDADDEREDGEIEMTG